MRLFFDVFKNIDFPRNLNEHITDMYVDRVVHSKKTGGLKVYVVVKHLVHKRDLSRVEEVIQKQLTPDESVPVSIIERFELEEELTGNEVFRKYKDSLIWELKRDDVFLGHLLDLSKVTEEEGTMVFTVYNNFFAATKGDELCDFLRDTIKNRFGLEFNSRLVALSDHARHEEFLRRRDAESEQIINQISDTYIKAKLDNDRINDDELMIDPNSIDKSAKEGIPQNADNSTSNKNVDKAQKKFTPKRRYEKGYGKKYGSKYQKKEKNPNIIYGSDTDGAISLMEDIVNIDGEATFRAKIFKQEIKSTKKEGFSIMLLNLTDFTDSIQAKMFLKDEIVNDIKGKLAEGNYVIVKGVVMEDMFTHEKTISRVIGISKTQDFSFKRYDTALDKRVELHCHTKSSDMDGVSDARTIVRQAYEWGMPAVAITDHGVVYAFPDANHERQDIWKEYKKKCEKEGVEPVDNKDFFKVIYGMEGYLVNDIDEEDVAPILKKNTYHIILLAQNEEGRKNMYRLVSKSHLEYYAKRPRIPKSELLKYKEGIIIGSACEAGEIFQAIEKRKPDEYIRTIAELYDYLEIQPTGNNHFMLLDDEKYPDIMTEEDLRDFNRKIVALGEELNKPVVATCDAHFLNPEDEIYRRIVMTSHGYKDADNQAPLYFRTTDEMLEEFSYLGYKKAEEVVITNTRKITDMVEVISPVRPDKCPPVIENSDLTLREICENKAHELYGENLPKIVEERMNKELDSIINNGYSVMYIIAQKLVWKSVEDGYLVGSRGSVGSSFAAFLAGITEVNSLAPHYRCGKCFYTDFDSEEVKSFSGGAGCDMPNKKCPVCGEPLIKDGFDIPFETFLGFNGDKEPDIDLNFSGEYQAKAHKYTEVIFGKGQTFKAGTVGGIAEKTSLSMIRSYQENRGFRKRRCEIERLAVGCTGVRKSTGQHPGGIIVLPKGEEIHTFTPIQHPANDVNTDIITTHFDYHSIDHNLLKLDILGHDDPTMIRMLQDLTGLAPQDIPLDDDKVMSLFTSPNALGVTSEDLLGWKVGTLGVPEFGTDFVQEMLVEANPTQLSDLIRIAGLGHGTGVWLGNTRELIIDGTCTISTAICCRDDIMVYLIHMGLEPGMAFKIMEAVRKGKVADGSCDKWDEWKGIMREKGIPDWYIDSCKKIEYMFPKAHAAAYVMMGWRIAYCKLYYPLEYYAAYFSIRADNFSYQTMCQGRAALEDTMKPLISSEDVLEKSKKDTLKDMRSVQEMYARGFEFLPIDLYRADAKNFKIIDGKLMPPFASVEGIGINAAENIARACKDNTFISKQDLKDKAGIGQSVIDVLTEIGVLEGLPDSNQMSLFEFFGNGSEGGDN